ncbi:MAG TPA: protein kinase [Blastocatellia bacterium]|nr:protein kinase [Blastocatellia bacterium]HMV86453.1 protein kinase [Blastocatellia bacterium]HMX27925.1 protein kinase [Blastocatellia bacterium]HMZ17111.1 protein kinase [Blastocatellia bacterium]HNG33728.1 protein kinase [Blastocatellia bacterium]
MLAPNTLLQDRYLVLRLLGQGGMGAVYQATDRKFGNAVAVKETFYSNEQLRRAFSREARLLNRLRHPALPVVMDYFSIADKQFLAMQYIPGQDLEQLLEERKTNGQGPFLVPQVMEWADRLLDALEYLHAQDPPVIHRDIKPQNLKLTPRGEVVLLDFGLAKDALANQPEEQKASQSLRGYTPHYASLEQIRGSGTDERSDLYSLAATLYHLLTGVMPPDAMTRMAAEMMGERDLLRLASELNPEVPVRVAEALHLAMAQQPESRFASAAVMRQALRNAARNVSISNFHRSPTLVNGWASSPNNASGKDGQPDSLIILLDEKKPDSGWHVVEDDAQKPAGKRQEAQSAKKRSRRSRTIWYAMCALVLMALTTAMMVRNSQLTKQNLFGGAVELATTRVIPGNTTLEAPMRAEVLRYFLEVLPADGKATARVTGMTPLASGSRFKFHFKPRQNGYFYLLALGKNGKLQTFLTERPMPASGVTTNRSVADGEYQFPDAGQFFMLPRDAETAPFTIIFSQEPLKTPGFLTMQSGHELTDTELQELAELRKRSASISPNLVALVDDNQPVVAVQILAARDKSESLVFDISVKRK